MTDTESIVQPRPSKDERIRQDWDNVMFLLRIIEETIDDGGALILPHHESLGPGADPVELMRLGLVRKIDRILAGARVA